MQRNISAAICGAGNIAKSHAIVLREMGIPILLVVDINEERQKPLQRSMVLRIILLM